MRPKQQLQQIAANEPTLPVQFHTLKHIFRTKTAIISQTEVSLLNKKYKLMTHWASLSLIMNSEANSVPRMFLYVGALLSSLA